MLVATPLQVEISVVARGDAEFHVVVAEGELDLVTLGAFEEQLDALVDGSGRRVLLDLSTLAFIDSTGLATLYRAYSTFAHFAVVVAPAAHVAKTIEMSGFDRMLPLFHTREEAFQALE